MREEETQARGRAQVLALDNNLAKNFRKIKELRSFLQPLQLARFSSTGNISCVYNIFSILGVFERRECTRGAQYRNPSRSVFSRRHISPSEIKINLLRLKSVILEQKPGSSLQPLFG